MINWEFFVSQDATPIDSGFGQRLTQRTAYQGPPWLARRRCQHYNNRLALSVAKDDYPCTCFQTSCRRVSIYEMSSISTKCFSSKSASEWSSLVWLRVGLSVACSIM